MATYTYPHVEYTQSVAQRSTPVVVESNATKLLAPFVCDRGPTNELVAIDTYSDFVNTFGTLNYKNPGQEQILNIGNWLSNGGRVLACRLTPTALKNYLYTQSDAIDIEDTLSAPIVPTGATFASDQKVRSTKFVWKTSEDAADVYNENEYIKIYFIPSYTLAEEADKVYAPELLIEVNTLDTEEAEMELSGVETYALKNTQMYYFALATAVDMSVDEGKTLIFPHEGTSGGDYYKFINNGLTLTDLVFETSGTYRLRASLVANVSLGNILVISDTVTSKSFSTGITVISPENVIADIAEQATGEKLVINKTKIYFKTRARYVGSYYNNIVVNISTTLSRGVPYFTVLLQKSENNKVVNLERFNNLTIDELYLIENNSQYLEYLHITDDSNDEIDSDRIATEVDLQNDFNLIAKNTVSITLDNGRDGSTDIQSFLVESLTSVLSRPLETPFDVFIDPGYKLEVKKDLIKLFCNTSTDISDVVRNDAFLILSSYELGMNGASSIGASTRNNIDEIDVDELRPESGNIDGTVCDFFNMEVIKYVHKIEDIYSLSEGREVFVPTTYFYAGLIPVNDATYGVQYPTAGTTRGVITGSLWIDGLPTNAEKQEYYNKHLNYVEKDSRGMYIMTQLTGDVNNTALIKIGSARALLKIKRELSTTARRYIHEFNDRITKKNLENSLNIILSNWIQNRTLSYGSLSISDYTENPSLLDSELEIAVQVKFTGYIDVISFKLVVE